jgi:virginiamycin A acetyltransferase
MREQLKSVARAAAKLAVLPNIVSFRLWALAVGRDRAFESAAQTLSRVPGLRGQYLRRAFLAHAIEHCDPTAAICYGTLFSKIGAIIDANVYVGPGCHLGLVHLERNVLLADSVHVPSGGHTHGTENPDIPIREQPGRDTLVRIGAGTWVGSAAVILADVGSNCIIGAGSVVTRPIPNDVVAAGVPARVIRIRPACSGDRRHLAPPLV